MPRFARLLLAAAGRNWMVVGVIVASLALLLFYTMGSNKQSSYQTSESVEIEGVAPTEDAGLLGSLTDQRIQMEQLRNELKQLKQEIVNTKKQEEKPAVRHRGKPEKDHAFARELQEQMQQLQAQMQRAKSPVPAPVVTPPPPAPSGPGIVIRTVRRGSGSSSRSAPQPRGIQVSHVSPLAATSTSEDTPYLPPQSYASGHVIDGYTGLASETGFPLVIAIDQPFLTANNHTVPVTGCRLGARASTEELTARSRALLTNITCVDHNGQTMEQPIEGYITAADNVHGGFAQVFWHERELVKAFAKSAIPVTLVSLFKETRRTISAASLTGVVSSTGNSVAQQVAGRMANIYLDKAEKLASPVVWVKPNAPVYIYITKGAALDPYIGHAPSAVKSEPIASRLTR